MTSAKSRSTALAFLTVLFVVPGAVFGSAGCSGGPSSASLSGAYAFPVNAAEALATPSGIKGQGPNQANIILEEVDGGSVACVELNPAHSLGGTVSLNVYAFLGTATDTTPLAPGTFPIQPNAETGQNQASLSLVSAPGAQPIVAQSGTLTLTEADTSYAGSFTATLPLLDGGAAVLQGTFLAPICAD